MFKPDFLEIMKSAIRTFGFSADEVVVPVAVGCRRRLVQLYVGYHAAAVRTT